MLTRIRFSLGHLLLSRPQLDLGARSVIRNEDWIALLTAIASVSCDYCDLRLSFWRHANVLCARTRWMRNSKGDSTIDIGCFLVFPFCTLHVVDRRVDRLVAVLTLSLKAISVIC
jgi:hypothetical protein